MTISERRTWKLTATAAGAALLLATALAPARAADGPQWRIAKLFPHVEQELAVSAGGARSAWAAGFATGFAVKLTVHRWNGRTWQRISPPAHLGHLDVHEFLAPVGASSRDNAWVFPALYRGGPQAYALHWHHSHWTVTRLARRALITDTAVFGQANAWAFGTAGTGTHLAPLDLHYNGKRWRKITLPAAPNEVSALSSGNVWAIGPTRATLRKPYYKHIIAVMHWNGHVWTSRRLPAPRVPRNGFLNTTIAAGGARGLWVPYQVEGPGGNPVSGGLLHLDRGRWHHLRLPAALSDNLNSAAPDGTGGFWVCTEEDLYHYNAGHWTRQHLSPDTSLIQLARIPGTRHAWAAGAKFRGPKLLGAILTNRP